MRARAAALVLLPLLGIPLPAAANGRFPAATQIVAAPGGAPELFVGATTGLLVSHDKGASFSWICEELTGFAGAEDPSLALFDTGALLVASSGGLATSSDKGCSFSFANGELQKAIIADVAVQRDDPSRAVALAITFATSSDGDAAVYETIDRGGSWHAVGVALPGLQGLTLDVAPSRPQRIYVTGTTGFASTLAAALFFTDDRGSTWASSAVALTPKEKGVFLGAIDPLDPDLVYLRTTGSGADRLLVSADGGKSVQELWTASDRLLGLALSPDGSSIALGGPKMGMYIGKRGESGLAQQSDLAISGLAWNGDGLYASGTDVGSPSVSVSIDEGKSWETLLELVSASNGLLTSCAPSSPYAKTCPAVWLASGGLLLPDAGADGGEPPDAGVPDGAPGAGGAAGSSSLPPPDASTTSEPAASGGQAPGGGSGCQVGTSAAPGPAGLLAAALCCLRATRRRRGARRRAAA
jgi:hypothetical protein